MELQPTHLSNDLVRLVPLQPSHWEALYAVASDPLIWAQHPNPNRYQEPIFRNFFEGALDSGGAFIIYDTASGQAIGSTRYYDFEPEASNVKIGYTFLARAFWGGKYNPAVKHLLLNYALTHVQQVIFHVGEQNLRSQIAMERLGAERLGLEDVAYYGEASKTNVVFGITRSQWLASRPNP